MARVRVAIKRAGVGENEVVSSFADKLRMHSTTPYVSMHAIPQYRTRNTGAAAKTLCYLFWGQRFEGAGAALIFALAQHYHTDDIADLEYKTMLQQALDHHLICNPAELAERCTPTPRLSRYTH